MLVWNLKDEMTMEITQILVDTTDWNLGKVESFLILDKWGILINSIYNLYSSLQPLTLIVFIYSLFL